MSRAAGEGVVENEGGKRLWRYFYDPDRKDNVLGRNGT